MITLSNELQTFCFSLWHNLPKKSLPFQRKNTEFIINYFRFFGNLKPVPSKWQVRQLLGIYARTHAIAYFTSVLICDIYEWGPNICFLIIFDNDLFLYLKKISNVKKGFVFRSTNLGVVNKKNKKKIKCQALLLPWNFLGSVTWALRSKIKYYYLFRCFEFFLCTFKQK